jgi:hypothetical protein
MIAGFKRIRPSGPTWRKLGLAGFVAGVAALAFFWGRHGAMHAVAQGPQGARGGAFPDCHAGSDYNRRIVAYIHGNIPITREDLGEYLIARFGAQRVEYLVNRRIIELACQARGVTVSDVEVDSQMKEDLESFKGTIANEQEFADKILKRYNKTLYEWREDVIRPKLALSKFCRDQIQVTDEDIQHAYEARYGERIKCKMIVLPQTMGLHNASELWGKVKDSDAEFDNAASSQFIPELRARKGEIPEIHKHFGDLPSEQKIEEAAFALHNPGDVSALLAMPDKTFIILKLVERLPPITAVNLSEARPALHKEVFENKLARAIPVVFQGLRQKANPTILMTREAKPGDLERQVERQLNIPPQGLAGAPAGH